MTKRIKYRDGMSPKEEAALLAQCEADNEMFEAMNDVDDEVANEHDEWRELRKAALNHRGQP